MDPFYIKSERNQNETKSGVGIVLVISYLLFEWRGFRECGILIVATIRMRRVHITECRASMTESCRHRFGHQGGSPGQVPPRRGTLESQPSPATVPQRQWLPFSSRGCRKYFSCLSAASAPLCSYDLGPRVCLHDGTLSLTCVVV